MKIIEKLTQNLQKTTVRPSLQQQWLSVFSVLLTITSIYTYGLGIWPKTLSELLSFPPLFYSITALLLLALLSYQCILYSIPGKKSNITLTLLSITSISIVSALLYFLLKNTSQNTFFYWENTYTCALKIIIMSIIPILFLTHQINKNYVLNKKKAMAILFLTSGVLGLTVITFHCPIMDPIHILLWHILPIIMLGFLGWSMSYFHKNKNSYLNKKRP